MPSRINWDAIKAEYIAGDDAVTIRAIADRHGVNFATVGRKASKEAWVNARSTYRQQVAAKTLNRVSTTEAELRAKQLRVSDALLSKGLTAMQTMNPTTYAEALRTVETALEQSRKAAGIQDRASQGGVEGDEPAPVKSFDSELARAFKNAAPRPN